MGYVGRHRAPDPPPLPRVAMMVTALLTGVGSVLALVSDRAPTSPPPTPPVATTLLVTPPVAATTPRRSTPTPTAAAPSPVSTPSAPQLTVCNDAGRWGTKTHVTQAGHHIAERFNVSGSRIGGYRARAIDRAGHPAGLALDFTVNRGTGDRIAAYVLKNRDRLAVTYVIWRQRINHGSGWRRMQDRGGATANHYDHVHVSFEARPSGAVITC